MQAELRTMAQCMEYPIAQMGGTEILFRALVRRFSEDFRVVVVSDDDEASLQNSGYAPYITKHISLRQFRELSSQQMGGQFRELEVDITHVHFGGPYTWDCRLVWKSPAWRAARSGIPTLMTNHLALPALEGFCGPFKPTWFKAALFPGAWVNRLILLRSMKRVYTVSNHDRDLERRVFWPVAGNIERFYHSILEENQDQPRPAADRRREIFNLGTIGRRKGQVYLVRAFLQICKRFPDWKLILAGRVAEEAYLKEIEEIPGYHDHRDQIQLPGRIDDDAMNDLLQNAAIFAMPSVNEGLGLSLQEALYHGCACVGSRAGGIPDLILHDKTGLLVPPTVPDALAEGLEKLMTDVDLRQRLATAGRAHVLDSGMTETKMVDRYAQAYREVLKGTS